MEYHSPGLLLKFHLSSHVAYLSNTSLLKVWLEIVAFLFSLLPPSLKYGGWEYAIKSFLFSLFLSSHLGRFVFFRISHFLFWLLPECVKIRDITSRGFIDGNKACQGNISNPFFCLDCKGCKEMKTFHSVWAFLWIVTNWIIVVSVY